MSIIENIKSPKDLKKLSRDELKNLCGEIRQFIIESVSQTGGHLSSILGVIELTVALHFVFDAPKDKLVWDVGHGFEKITTRNSGIAVILASIAFTAAVWVAAHLTGNI